MQYITNNPPINPGAPCIQPGTQSLTDQIEYTQDWPSTTPSAKIVPPSWIIPWRRKGNHQQMVRSLNVMYLIGSPLSMYICRAASRFVLSQWETALLCNDVSHWLGANLKSALYMCGNWVQHVTASRSRFSLPRLGLPTTGPQDKRNQLHGIVSSGM